MRCVHEGVVVRLESSRFDATDFVATLTHPLSEYVYGVTLPAHAAMFTRLYMEKYGVTERHLAMVAVKNQNQAMANEFAHLHQTITIEGILDSPEAMTNNPYVAEPLRFFDCCPVSDGGACLLLASADVMARVDRPRVRLAGVGQATDCHAVAERADPTELTAVRLAAERSLAMAGYSPADVDVAELHDAFTIEEILYAEAMGLCVREKPRRSLLQENSISAAAAPSVHPAVYCPWAIPPVPPAPDRSLKSPAN